MYRIEENLKISEELKNAQILKILKISLTTWDLPGEFDIVLFTQTGAETLEKEIFPLNLETSNSWDSISILRWS